MRTSTKVIGSLALLGVVAAGSAFTASNTVPDSVAGYGSSTISGATATSLNYTLNTDGTQITGATLRFVGDLTGKTVRAGFGTNALTACTLGTVVADNPLTLTEDETATPVTCSGYTQSTSTATSFNVAVS